MTNPYNINTQPDLWKAWEVEQARKYEAANNRTGSERGYFNGKSGVWNYLSDGRRTFKFDKSESLPNIAGAIGDAYTTTINNPLKALDKELSKNSIYRATKRGLEKVVEGDFKGALKDYVNTNLSGFKIIGGFLAGGPAGAAVVGAKELYDYGHIDASLYKTITGGAGLISNLGNVVNGNIGNLQNIGIDVPTIQGGSLNTANQIFPDNTRAEDLKVLVNKEDKKSQLAKALSDEKEIRKPEEIISNEYRSYWSENYLEGE